MCSKRKGLSFNRGRKRDVVSRWFCLVAEQRIEKSKTRSISAVVNTKVCSHLYLPPLSDLAEAFHSGASVGSW